MRWLGVRRIVWGVLGLACGLLPLGQGGQAAQIDTGVYIDIRASEAPGAPVVERWKLYGASHALVIGIDAYTNGWPRLSNAVKDARLVAAALRARGFEVTLLSDVTFAELRDALRRFFALKGANPEARLFLWFAGHGHTEYGEGYIVPADAPAPGSPEFLLSALHMGDLGTLARIARSKHVLAVFDSCFAGTIFTAQRARPPAAITRAAVQPVRQFLTSGDADQKVSDDGTFRELFLRALRGEESSDANGDGYVTGTELSLYLENRVTNLTRAAQTPRSGKLRDPKFDRGDFVFVVPGTALAATSAPAAPAPRATGPSRAAFELEFWNAIKGSSEPADYQAYLDAYPDGHFASLARRRAQTATAQAPQQEARLTPPQDPPVKSIEEVERYLEQNKRKILDALIEYNNREIAFVTNSPWGGANFRYTIRRLYSLKVVALEGDRIFLRTVFCITVPEMRSCPVFKAQFKFRWVGDELEVVGHKKL